MNNLRIVLSLAFAFALPAAAQELDPSLHTNADIQQHAAKLTEAARTAPTGYASDVLDELPTARTLLVVRVRTGLAERHLLWADQMVILSGNATLVTGGIMQSEKPNGTAQGESLATGIQGGKETQLHPGDIVHVPASVPHWVKLAPGTTFTYFVFKEK
jgi:mannose-6-phosphate isomerase-like protein (cupin superfamily)